MTSKVNSMAYLYRQFFEEKSFLMSRAAARDSEMNMYAIAV